MIIKRMDIKNRDKRSAGFLVLLIISYRIKDTMTASMMMRKKSFQNAFIVIEISFIFIKEINEQVKKKENEWYNIFIKTLCIFISYDWKELHLLSREYRYNQDHPHKHMVDVLYFDGAVLFCHEQQKNKTSTRK